LRDNDSQTISDETRELLDDMCDWLEIMKRKIMDYITARYFREGKIQYCEILKRRYKDQYSEKVEQEVVADVVADTSVNIVIEDYDGEDN
jgi:gluconate kinase